MIRFLPYSLTVLVCISVSTFLYFNNFQLSNYNEITFVNEKQPSLTDFLTHFHSLNCDKDNHLTISSKSNFSSFISNHNHIPNFDFFHKKNTSLEESFSSNIKELQLRLESDNYQVRTIVIDPGHGGHDHGCSGIFSKEKHVALKISKKLGNYIETVYPEINVIFTRDSDVFVPLYNRAKIANDNKADLFISIHCNAISKYKEQVKGTETYVMGLHDTNENLDVAKRENESILLEEDYQKHYDGFDPNSPEGHIILSMVQNLFLEQSILFAEKVERNFAEKANRKSRGVKQAGFVVLRKTTMPSVLIETGYLTNSSEEKFLNNDFGQDELANAIFRAFQSYKIEIENANMNIPQPIPAKVIPRLKVESTKEKENLKEKPVDSSKEINPAEQRMYFTVQLAASPKPLNLSAKKWKKINFLVELRRENGKFKYLAGKFKTENEAFKALSEIRSIGFKNAQIVQYKDNKKIEPNYKKTN